LPEAAQRVLGEPDPRALLAYEIHLEEGFEPDRYVDIFDAGPVLTAQVDRTASVAGNATRVVRESASANAEVSETYLVASQQGGEFRCVLATLPVQEASTYAPHAPHAPLALVADAPLDAATRAALNVQDGARVRCAPLYRETPDNDNSMGEAQ
ncbi:MAG: arginine N-succinyltransferase, partial [Paraburkholderia tropica]